METQNILEQKNKNKKLISPIIKKYFPDIIIFLGVWLYLQPEIFGYHYYESGMHIKTLDGKLLCSKTLGCKKISYYNTDWKEIGIIIILIGIDIIIRKYLDKKNKK